MASLKDKLQNSLDESRMLILGTQVILGFHYRAVFESGFDQLPRAVQQLEIPGLALLIAALTLLLSPVAFHHIVLHGESSDELNEFASQVMGWALLPFAASLGIGIFIVVSRMALIAALVTSVAIVTIALFSWYGLGAIGKSQGASPRPALSKERLSGRDMSTKLSDEIRASLTEARMVLPGAQAMLGFQTIIMLNSDFEKLPVSSQYVHLASLLMTALATILLMTPAAYHRIAEDGEDSESFYRLCSRFVLAAMVPLALGITGDLLVVVRRLTGSLTAGTITSLLVLVIMYGLWFGYTLYRRRTLKRDPAFQVQRS